MPLCLDICLLGAFFLILYELKQPTAPPAATKQDYYRARIGALGLSQKEAATRYGFTSSPDGDLLLAAFRYSGARVEYIPKDRQRAFRNLQKRKTTGETHEHSYFQQYARRRLHPEHLASWQQDFATGRTDSAPAKYLAPPGETVPPFPMPAAREAYQQGFTGGPVVFVEGEIKAAALDRVGVESVAFGGLSLYRLDSETRDYITRRRPDSILVLYDGDALDVRLDSNTGNLTSKRRQDFYQSARRFTGQLFDLLAEIDHSAKVYWCAVNPDHQEKGADDLLVASDRPLVAARELATATAGDHWTFARLHPGSYDTILRHTFALDDPERFYQDNAGDIGQQVFSWWGLDYQQREGALVMVSDPYAVTVPTVPLKVTRWLSEGTDAIEKQLTTDRRLAIQSETGTGKTTYFIQRAQRTGRGLLLLAPTRSICRQLAEQHPGAYSCIGANTTERAADAAAATVVVATYDTAHHIPDVDRRTVVVDEAHDLVNHYNFRATALNRLHQVIEKAGEVVYLSGTMPRALLKTYDVPLVDVRRTSSPRVRLHYLKAENSKPRALSEALLSSLVADLRRDPHQVHFALYNSTEQLDAIRGELVNAGHLQPHQIQVFSRNHYERGGTSAFDDLERLQQIREGVRLVLCTSIISEGVNIKNTNVGQVYSVGVYCPDTVRQFAARFRCMDVTDLFLILKPGNAPGRDFSRDAEGLLAYLTDRAQLTATHATRLSKHQGADDLTRSEFFPHIMPDPAGEGYMVDRLAILADVRRQMIKNAPPAYLLARLAEFDGFDVYTVEDAQLDSEAVDGLKASQKATRDAQLDALDRLRGELVERPEVALAALYRHYQATRDSNAAKDLRHLAADALARVPDLDALEWGERHRATLDDKAGRELIRRTAQLHFAGVADLVPWLNLSAREWGKEWTRTRTAYGLAVVNDRKQARHLPAGLRLDLKAKQLIGEQIDAYLAANGPTVSDLQLAELIQKVFTTVDRRTGVHSARCLVDITRGRAVQLAGELYHVSTTRHGDRRLVTFGDRQGHLSTGMDFVCICTAFREDPLKIKGLRGKS